MITRDHIKQVLDWLGLSDKTYKLFMGASLCARGYRNANDIDLGVTNDKFKSLCDRFNVKPNDHSVLGRTKIDIPTPVGNVEVYPLYDFESIEEVNGFLCQPLEEVIRLKRHLGREKDIKDLTLIESKMTQIEA